MRPSNENTFYKCGHDDFSRYKNAEFQTIKSLPVDKKKCAYTKYNLLARLAKNCMRGKY